MTYFANFPYILYDPTNSGKPVPVMNIMASFNIETLTKGSDYLYYEYVIQDGDRPDILAHKYYENSNYDWIILLTNKIFDPYYEWPLNSQQFDDFIRNKYGSSLDANSEIHHFEYTIEAKYSYIPTGTDTIVNVPERTLVVDQDTYLALPVTANKRMVSLYEYEQELNDARRNIKILDKRYLPEILQKSEVIFDE